ncbi:LysM peptidoglycan-binding domain-containing protein, partial [Staphylococcus aureus]
SETSDPASSSSAEDTTQSSAAVSGETIAVQAGEGRDMIAARAGISPEELERLNPDKMTGPGGTWWANPGDLVKIK